MKKKNKFLWLLPLVILGMAQCRHETTEAHHENKYSKADYLLELGTHEGLDEDTEWQIVQAYLKKLQSGGEHGDLTINDVWVEKYFGAYCPPYIVQDLYNDGKTWDEIYYGAENQTVIAVMIGVKGQDNGAGQQVSIHYGRNRAFVRDGNKIFLWYNGQLDALADPNVNPNLLSSWDFLGITNLQNGLDFETQSRIQEDFSKSMRWTYNEIPIHYLGAYNGYITIMAPIGAYAMMGHLTIGDVHFVFSSIDDRLFAWKEGELYELPYLYEQGLITREDLVTMAYNLYGYGVP